jgi:hypothetical protein
MSENRPVKRIGLVLGLLSCAAGAVLFASRLWDWVLNFDPGFVFTHSPAPTGSPSSAGVTILLIDGLRLDASRSMPALNALRAQGADIEALVGTPSFSRPGRATIAVGAPPAIHGVTTNRQGRAIPLDNIIRRVGDLSGTCRIAGSRIWSSLFGKDIERCGVYREGEGKEGPGAFVRQAPQVREAQEAGVDFVLAQKATLRIADIISTDFAAHEYGGSSPQYRAEVQRADALLAHLVQGLDLTRETLVVTADHGHRDAGGHGGDEPEVLAIPIVMAGAGIKPLTSAKASQADIAPTVAALLGATLPTGSSGAPIDSVLARDEAERALLAEAVTRQRVGFEAAVGARLGVMADRSGKSDWAALAFASRDARKERRIAILILPLALIPAAALMMIHLSRPSALGLGAGMVAGILALLGPIGSRIPILSFSAINYDEMLLPFFERMMTLASATTLIAAMTAMVFGYVFRRLSPGRSAFADAGSMGLMVSAALAAATSLWWWYFDLLNPLTLPLPGRLVEAYSLTLSTLSCSVTTLALLVALWLIEAAGRSRDSTTELVAT